MNSNDFNEKVKRNVAGNFDQSLAFYQAFEAKHHFFAALASTLAEKISLRPNTHVLDVGCGNGISSRTLNERFGCRVLGVDLSSKMVAAGQGELTSENVRLIVGDGERLAEVVGNQTFDYVLYNASIFIFPDVNRALQEAVACLKPEGEIAFSFYPHLAGPTDEDLLIEAFDRVGEPRPRFRVITDYDKACQALARHCGKVSQHRWVRPLDIEFLQDFFSIPAQSASLFPGMDYQARRKKIIHLFSGLSDIADNGTIVWRMARGKKPASV
ncbi:MAG: class I SAM-dependent methyltransferase [Desulfobacterales bacterium]|nr:class I SAM-dependent methyltransferase [Desulfobacterales bacterium]